MDRNDLTVQDRESMAIAMHHSTQMQQRVYDRRTLTKKGHRIHSPLYKPNNFTDLCLEGERGGQLAAQFATEDGKESDSETSHDDDGSVLSD